MYTTKLKTTLVGIFMQINDLAMILGLAQGLL